MKAWLVTWEWCGDHAVVEDNIAAILNSRLSGEHVREIVELLYVNSQYCLSERLNYANVEVAKTIKAHWSGIINYTRTKITNGVLEGINSIVQSLKSNARGFRTTKNLILIIYLRLGKLQFNLPM